jgi:hypothetical protein
VKLEIKRWRFILVVVLSGVSSVLAFSVALHLLTHSRGFLDVLALAFAAGLSGSVSIALLLLAHINGASN